MIVKWYKDRNFTLAEGERRAENLFTPLGIIEPSPASETKHINETYHLSLRKFLLLCYKSMIGEAMHEVTLDSP
jgi:hypothetical protein